MDCVYLGTSLFDSPWQFFGLIYNCNVTVCVPGGGAKGLETTYISRLSTYVYVLESGRVIYLKKMHNFSFFVDLSAIWGAQKHKKIGG